MQYDYSFPPRDDIWFHIPRSFVLFLTLLVLLCHFTNVTAQAHQSLSVLGRKTSMASSHKHSEWRMSPSTSRALCQKSPFNAKSSAICQPPRGSGWPPHDCSPGLSSCAASWVHLPSFTSHAFSSPYRLVTFVSLGFRPFFWPWAWGLACIMLTRRIKSSSTGCPHALWDSSQRVETASAPHSPFVLNFCTLSMLTTARHRQVAGSGPTYDNWNSALLSQT